jgi:hypothetical protein
MGVRTFLPLALVHLAKDLANRRSSNSPAGIIIKHVRAGCDGNGLELPSVERTRACRTATDTDGDVKNTFCARSTFAEEVLLLVRREELFEGGFVEDGDAEGLGFVEF